MSTNRIEKSLSFSGSIDRRPGFCRFAACETIKILEQLIPESADTKLVHTLLLELVKQVML